MGFIVYIKADDIYKETTIDDEKKIDTRQRADTN